MRLLYHRKPVGLILTVAVALGSLYLGYQLIRSYFTDRGRFKQPGLLVGRTDVVTVTPWLAPIVWEKTFDPLLFDSIYRPQNITIATIVFAIGKHVNFLWDFLETAEKYFFIGLRVHYYVFTNQPNEVRLVNMTAGRQVTVLSLPSSIPWREISTHRMELIQAIIESDLSKDTDYIFCLDVDSKFHGHWGAESLDNLVAVIHPGYYADKRDVFPYERHPLSRAYVARGDGDFYYSRGVFGGLLKDVHALAKTCRDNYDADAAQGVEAVRQEESHLNRYFMSNKPSKVLSPEYLWEDTITQPPAVRLIRLSRVKQNYTEIHSPKSQPLTPLSPVQHSLGRI